MQVTLDPERVATFAGHVLGDLGATLSAARIHAGVMAGGFHPLGEAGSTHASKPRTTYQKKEPLMFHRSLITVIAASLAACASVESPKSTLDRVEAETEAARPPEKSESISFEIAFKTHLEMDLPEQDVFLEREKGSGEVYRVTKGDNDMNAPLFKSATETAHDPFNAEAVGPHAKGAPLGMTLGQWLRHRGTGSYEFENGVGRLDLEFTGLVPNGVYTMWHVFIALPPTQPFSGTLDLPLGARDGSESVFRADEDGKARFTHSFRPGLQLSDVWTTSMLAIAYHSDGKTYGGSPGPFGLNTHVPLFVMLPKRAGLE